MEETVSVPLKVNDKEVPFKVDEHPKPDTTFERETVDVLKNCQICDHLEENFVNQIKYACVYLKNEAYVVNDQDQVFNIINNQCYRVDFLSGKGVIKFAYSYSTKVVSSQTSHQKPSVSSEGSLNYHMLALTKDGRVFGWGENAFDQITNKRGRQLFDPVRIDFSYGYYMAWRSWVAGKLLEISETVILNTFSDYWKSMGLVLVNRIGFRMIACGQAHCMAVTTDNSIVVWGSNKYGQIGNGKQSDVEDPFKILVNKEHIKDYPPKSHNKKGCCLWLCATITGLIITLITFIKNVISLIVWMIISSCVKIREAPTYFQEDRDIESGEGKNSRPNLIRAIACGAAHNLVLFENGDVWGWGDNEFGQLGRVTGICHTEPRPLYSNAISIAAINNHSLVLCTSPQGTFLYTMGDNTYGQLGEFDPIQCRIPLRIERKPFYFQDIATVNGISLAITARGTVFAWGLYRFEEIKERETNVMTDSKKAYIIEEPKKVNCRSINEFIARYSSLTRDTIEIGQASPGGEAYEQGTVLIEESELKIVEYVSTAPAPASGGFMPKINVDPGNRTVTVGMPEKGTGEEETTTTKVIHVSNVNKYVLFDGCNVTANRDLNVKDIKQTGMISKMFGKKNK